jgi:hypothetical protein
MNDSCTWFTIDTAPSNMPSVDLMVVHLFRMDGLAQPSVHCGMTKPGTEEWVPQGDSAPA